jgi:hypothetical protein
MSISRFLKYLNRYLFHHNLIDHCNFFQAIAVILQLSINAGIVLFESRYRNLSWENNDHDLPDPDDQDL